MKVYILNHCERPDMYDRGGAGDVLLGCFSSRENAVAAYHKAKAQLTERYGSIVPVYEGRLNEGKHDFTPYFYFEIVECEIDEYRFAQNHTEALK